MAHCATGGGVFSSRKSSVMLVVTRFHSNKRHSSCLGILPGTALEPAPSHGEQGILIAGSKCFDSFQPRHTPSQFAAMTPSPDQKPSRVAVVLLAI